MTGQVRMYDSQKGHGYITGEDGKSYFVLARNVHTRTGSLAKGYIVEFTPAVSNRGFEAEDVVIF